MRFASRYIRWRGTSNSTACEPQSFVGNRWSDGVRVNIITAHSSYSNDTRRNSVTRCSAAVMLVTPALNVAIANESKHLISA